MDRQVPTMIPLAPAVTAPPERVEFPCEACGFIARTEVGRARHVHSVHGFKGVAQAINQKRLAMRNVNTLGKKNIAVRGNGATPSPSSIGDTTVAPVQFDYSIEAYPTIDMMSGNGPSRAGSGTVPESPPMLTVADRKVRRIGG